MIKEETTRQKPRRRVALVLVAMAAATVLASVAAVQPAQAAFPGKNGKIAFTSLRDGNDEIYVMNQDGSNQENLSNNRSTDRDPAWSPDGKKIAFTSFRDGGGGQIFVMNQDGSDPVNLSNDPAAGDEAPYWSPDGKKIVFAGFRDSNNGGRNVGEVYVMDTDPNTNDATNLTNTPGDEFDPAFSPDGKKIVFENFQEGRGEIFTMNPDGSNPTNISNSILNEDFTADFSPSAKKIAFASFRDGNSEVYVMNADGNNQTRLTNNNADDVFPAFSPNGRKIAFQSDRDGNKDIFVMNTDGTGQTNLTKLTSQNDTQPDWQPIKKR